MSDKINRRTVLLSASAVAATWSGAAGAAQPTPRQTSGPFYPTETMRPGDTDWDLVRVAGQVRDAGGEVLHLSGRVTSADGSPVPDALIEIWQCDVNGRYLHTEDWSLTRSRDNGFQGFGAVRTDADGSYRFRTIKPVAYPGRTPHIHARVVLPEGRELVTQLYLRDEPLNAQDGLFKSLGASGQAALSIDPAPRADGDLEASFTFVV